ncbi:hypothetical protein BDA96_10G256100 [Sorghum bicolor]|uniref:Secreted protein n=2 Tax=Sorghum bicolor TaxID=4558 RepID=A0A921Q433_SORBI|nr:hypothetical protein BDA96_10G256100 [Sorghum bicolor]OQU76727.1 hypothetical protein SORBI_3010G196433 [Sorghum bicolor]
MPFCLTFCFFLVPAPVPAPEIEALFRFAEGRRKPLGGDGDERWRVARRCWRIHRITVGAVAVTDHTPRGAARTFLPDASSSSRACLDLTVHRFLRPICATGEVNSLLIEDQRCVQRSSKNNPVSSTIRDGRWIIEESVQCNH